MTDVPVMFRAAIQADLAPIGALLGRAFLPCDISMAMLASFIVAVRDTVIIGTVGFEPYGQQALLRSFAVDPSARGQGIGRELFRRVIERLSEDGITEVYVLTTTIEDLCVRWGFRQIARNDVPAEVAASSEFQGVCPSSAICMVRML